MSTIVATIMHTAITLLVIISKVVTIAPVITNSLVAVVIVFTSTNAITVSMYVIKALLVRTILVHIVATVWSGISVLFPVHEYR